MTERKATPRPRATTKPAPRAKSTGDTGADDTAAPGLIEDLRYNSDGTKSGKVPYLATAPEGQGIDRM